MKNILKTTEKVFIVFASITFVASLIVTLFHPDFAGPFAQDPIIKAQITEGAELYVSKNCASCHGPTGNEPAANQYPHLKGQSFLYLKSQLEYIMNGTRNSGLSGIMKNSVHHLQKAIILIFTKMTDYRINTFYGEEKEFRMQKCFWTQILFLKTLQHLWRELIFPKTDLRLLIRYLRVVPTGAR